MKVVQYSRYVHFVERAKNNANISNDEPLESFFLDFENISYKVLLPSVLDTVNIMNKTSLDVWFNFSLLLPTFHDVETTSDTQSHILFSLAVAKLIFLIREVEPCKIYNEFEIGLFESDLSSNSTALCSAKQSVLC